MKITEKLAAEYSGDLIKFVPDLENSSTFINVMSLNYNFTKDLSGREKEILTSLFTGLG